jgi:hypothetical protein
MSGQLPSTPGALVGQALWRILLLAVASALLLLLFGPVGLLVVFLAVLAWLAWRGGQQPAWPQALSPKLVLGGVALLALGLLVPPVGVVLLATLVLMVVIIVIALLTLGPARLQGIWLVCRAMVAFLVWLTADARHRLAGLSSLAGLLRDATAEAATACKPDGALRKPLADFKSGIDGLRVPGVNPIKDGEVTLLDVGKAEVKITKWKFEPTSVTPNGVGLVDGAVNTAATGLDGAATQLGLLSDGFGLLAEALDAAVAALPPES